MKLYGYFRSSAAFRVRIALNLKKLDYESAFIHLRRGDQRQPSFRGVAPGLADIALVPQVFNAYRYNSLDLAPYPTILRIYQTCLKLDAFAAAHPDRQPDHEA